MWTKNYEVACSICGFTKKFIADFRYPRTRGELNLRQAQALAKENGWNEGVGHIWTCPTCHRRKRNDKQNDSKQDGSALQRFRESGLEE